MVADGFFSQALSQNFSEFLRSLGETIYGPDLQGETLGDVDRAIAKHLARTVGDLPSLVSGSMREVIGLPLLRADLTNLKTILRGKTAGKSLEETKSSLVGGTLKEPLINAMLQAPDAAGVAQILQVPGHPLAKALRSSVATNPDPLALEVALDRDFFSATFEKAKKLGQSYVTNYFSYEVDATNLSTAFKLQALKVDANPESYFIPGGKHVNRTVFGRIAAGDLAAMDALNNTPFAPATSARTLGDLERVIRQLLLHKASKGGVDSLGAGLSLDYIRSKEWEASRIRLLARRAYFNLPADAIAKELA